jgi:hypothetical protein
MKKDEAPAGHPPEPRAIDDRELARFLRPQPPIPVPERVRPQPQPGLLAASLLGARVYPRSR